MIDRLSKFYADYKLRLYIDSHKKSNYACVEIINDASLKKYKPHLREIVKEHNRLLFEFNDKVGIQNSFAKLILIRTNDYFQSVCLCTFFRQNDSIFVLMRALTDTLFLLKYVDKRPKYIKHFMRKQKRGVHIRDIKKFVQDKPLEEYYDSLSNIIHSNPEGIKMNYYTTARGQKMIATSPVNQTKILEDNLVWLIYIMDSIHLIIRKIYSKNWNPHHDKTKKYSKGGA